MKALKIIGITVLGLVVVAAVSLSIMSPKTHMERSIVVNGSPASVLAEFSNFQKFNAWAPWAKMDPQAKYTFEGPETGVGAKMSWDGPETGKGSQETIEYEEGKRVKNVMKFDMIEGAMFSEVVVEAVPEGTKVIWYYDQDVSGTGAMNAAMGKFFGMGMEGMMGPQYEQGLKDMKQVVEAQPKFSVAITEEETKPINYIGISTTMSYENSEAIFAQMAKSYDELMGTLNKAKVEMDGHPMALYPKWDEATKQMEMVCAVPVPADAKVPAKYKVVQNEGGKVVKGVHMGNYNSMMATHEQISQYIAFKKLEITGAPWEVYLTNPMEEKDTTKWMTEIFYPVKQ